MEMSPSSSRQIGLETKSICLLIARSAASTASAAGPETDASVHSGRRIRLLASCWFLTVPVLSRILPLPDRSGEASVVENGASNRAHPRIIADSAAAATTVRHLQQTRQVGVRMPLDSLNGELAGWSSRAEHQAAWPRRGDHHTLEAARDEQRTAGLLAGASSPLVGRSRRRRGCLRTVANNACQMARFDRVLRSAGDRVISRNKCRCRHQTSSAPVMLANIEVNQLQQLTPGDGQPGSRSLRLAELISAICSG